MLETTSAVPWIINQLSLPDTTDQKQAGKLCADKMKNSLIKTWLYFIETIRIVIFS